MTSTSLVQRRRTQGFGVVELMIAIAISLLLLSGVVAIFVTSKNTYETVERLSRIQENGRFALDAIIRDIRSAGYVGCARPSSFESTLNNKTQLAWNFANSIAGHEFKSGTTWAPALPTGLTNIAGGSVNGSDALVLRVPALGNTSAPLRLTTKMASATANLQIEPIAAGNPAPIEVNQVVMLADCQARAVFEITSYSKTTGVIAHAVSAGTASSPGNESDDLKHPFDANAQLVRLQTVSYYIATSAGRTGLWRVSGGAAPEELVEGIERMELRFGEDTTGDRIADRYVVAENVTDWNNVINVSVALLVRSPDQYGTELDSKTYQLLDKTFTAPGDRHLRQIFTTTATLRNRAL